MVEPVCRQDERPQNAYLEINSRRHIVLQDVEVKEVGDCARESIVRQVKHMAHNLISTHFQGRQLEYANLAELYGDAATELIVGAIKSSQGWEHAVVIWQRPTA